MTLVYTLLIIVQVAVLVFFFWWNKKKKKVKPPANAYDQFREQALRVTPTQLKIAIPNNEILVYGVVMDWDLGDTMATVAVYITGAASMYFSTGSGKTGGGKSPAVGEAAVELVTTAQEYLNQAAVVEATEPPANGFITFHFLTNQRIFRARVPMSQFETKAGPWFPLFQKANVVVNTMHNDGNVNAYLN
jgi:hypothetical protein